MKSRPGSFRGRALTLLAVACGALAGPVFARELVYVDGDGTIRWTADKSEVALFGANYCLPSSSDYRAAGYLQADRKKLIEKDLAHFARMGWDGLRLAWWGDWENCDREGNLIANDHLDVFDYLVFQAKQRGLFMLLTPIHRHSALWPDGKDGPDVQGFSKFYPASELGTNPKAIAAEQNYIRQLLAHVNPYTGVALKDEPAVLFIELINEPHNHPGDFAGSVSYINALADAVRQTGCEKLLFFNLSQDFPMAPAIAASKAQGFTLGWYPTGLVARHMLRENYLRWVDDYSPMRAPEMPRLPRIVYEFDSADQASGYMYPAMVRGFRAAGAQFATMFAYDMLDTAPYNLGWQTHYLNLVYSPRKAVSAIIAAEAMRTLPRFTRYGGYPENRRFGPFRVSYEDDSSEMITPERFFHANDTITAAPDPAALHQIIGCGSSPLISYDGTGAYFLEKLQSGCWRLELYPDAVLVQDPFAQQLNYQSVSSRLVWRTRPMTVRLPDLGAEFAVAPLDAGNSFASRAAGGRFDIRPGVYLLERSPQQIDPATLPPRLGRVGLREFVCPPSLDAPPQVVPHLHRESVAEAPADVLVEIVTADPVTDAQLHYRAAGEKDFHAAPFTAGRGYEFTAAHPFAGLAPGSIEAFVTFSAAGATRRFPAEADAPWRVDLVAASTPLALFVAARDGQSIATSRGPSRHLGGDIVSVPASGGEPAALRLFFPAPGVKAPGSPRAFSVSIKERIGDRRPALSQAQAIRISGRTTVPGSPAQLTLVEADGTGWTASVALTERWSTVEVPLDRFACGDALKLPLGYPGNWNWQLTPANGRGGAGDHPGIETLEHLQVVLPGPVNADDDAHVDVGRVELVFR